MKLVRTTGGLLEASSGTLSATQAQRALDLARQLLDRHPALKDQVDQAAMERFADRLTQPAAGSVAAGPGFVQVQRFDAS